MQKRELKDLKMIFLGTPRFGVFVLDAMKKCGLMPKMVITTPDQPQGRGLVLTPPPVKVWAEKENIPVMQPETLKELSLNEEFDVFVLAAYGKLIPQKIIDIPKRGILNVHPSLLPRYRGASPIQATILNGDKEVGVAIMVLDDKMDHGPILSRKKMILDGTETYDELEKKLGEEGGRLICDALPDWIAEELVPSEQVESEATYCKKVEKKDGFISPYLIVGQNADKETLIRAERAVRALNPDPGTYTIIKANGKDTRIKILKARIENDKFVPEIVIPEGKKEMDWGDFLKGNTLTI